MGMEPRRMSAEEKDALLKAFHPDYREEAFEEIKIVMISQIFFLVWKNWNTRNIWML